MKILFYQLHSIPDLSLTKYASLSNSGVDGVLNRHKAFLRQWQRISLIENCSFHYFVCFMPTELMGTRIKICLEILCPDISIANRCHQLISASPLSEYYELIPYQAKINNKKITETFELYKRLSEMKFKFKSIFTKRERLYQSLVNKGNASEPLTFYTVSDWELNKEARLYDMFRVMETLNEFAVYRVDLFGIDAYPSTFTALKDPISKLQLITRNYAADKITLIDHKNNKKDSMAEEALRQYEKLLENTSNSPYFRMNISVLSNDPICSQIIMDSAGAEALEKGDYSISLLNEGNYDIFPKSHTEPQNWCSKQLPERLNILPTLFSIEEVLPYFCFPALFDGETIEMLKETDSPVHKTGIYLGVDENNRKVYFPIDNLNKHIFVTGMPGSGKTNTMLLLCYSLWKEFHIPFLVMEPAKKEYRSLAYTDLHDLVIFSPTSGTNFPLAINPFEFVQGLSLSEHIQNLMDVFEGAFPLFPPLPALLDRSIETIYSNLGWDTDDINDGKKSYPTMEELYYCLEKELKNTKYDSETSGNMQAALEMRIGALLRRDLGNVFNVQKSCVAPEDWLASPIVIEMESLGGGPSNFLTLMLCTLIRETLRVQPNANPEKTTRHVILIEEAHNLIGPQSYLPNSGNDNADPKIAATAYIVKMLAEVRALRESIIIADQLPTAMAPEVIKNTGTKITHRITAGDDRSLIGQTMAATSLQLEELAVFTQGQTLVSYEGLLRPFKMQMTLAPHKEKMPPTNDELYSLMLHSEKYKTYSTVCYINRLLSIQQKFENIYEKIEKEVKESHHLLNIEHLSSERELLKKAYENGIILQFTLEQREKDLKHLQRNIYKFKNVLSNQHLQSNINILNGAMVNLIQFVNESIYAIERKMNIIKKLYDSV